MAWFDPRRRTELLLGDTGYEFSLASDFAESQACGGLASSANAYLGKAVQCFLVGMDGPAYRLLEKSHEWLRAAIDGNEIPRRHFPDATEALRFQDLAMCNWMLRAEHDDNSLRQFVLHEDRVLAATNRGKDKVEVSSLLTMYADAGALERALEIFANTPRLSPPKSLKNIKSEAHMVYVLAQHHLHGQYSDGEVRDAANGFLSRNMDEWLDNGQFLTAAEWMKILFWNPSAPQPSPKETLLKCYDYLPLRSPPVSVSE